MIGSYSPVCFLNTAARMELKGTKRALQRDHFQESKFNFHSKFPQSRIFKCMSKLETGGSTKITTVKVGNK